MFDRHDHVVTICELKYHDSLIGKWIMEEVEKKIAMFGNTKKTIEKILITTNGVTKDLADTNFFSRVVLIDEIFNAG